MADHNEIVAFTLQQRGDLASSLPATARKLRDVGDSAGKAKREVADLGDLGQKAAQKMGGAFGDTYEVVAEILGPLATMGGTVASLAAGAAGGALAVAGLAVATKGLTDAGVAAAAELQAMGRHVDADSLAALNGYTAATKELGVQWKELQVSVGAELAPSMTTLANTLARIVDWLEKAREKTEGFREAVSRMRDGMVSVVSLGASTWLSGLAGDIDSAAASVDRLNVAVGRINANGNPFLGLPVPTEAERRAFLASEKALADYAKQLAKVRADARSAALLAATTQPVPVGFHASKFQDVAPLMGTMHGTGMPVGGIQGQDPVPVDIKDVTSVAADRLGSALGALRGGMSGLGALAGPWGALITAAIEMLPKIDETISDLHDQVMDWPDEVQGAIEQLLEDLPTYITEGVQHAAEGAALIPNLIAGLIAAAPQILGAVIEAALMGPQLIIEAMVDAFANIWEAIKNLPRELAQVLGNVGNKAGDLLGIHLGKDAKAKGEREFFGIRFDRFAMHGGVVTQSGMAMVHKGERIGPSRGRAGRGGGGSVTINVGSVVSNNPERFVEQLQSLLGGRGINLSLEPHGG